jgi:hypothetical protein
MIEIRPKTFWTKCSFIKSIPGLGWNGGDGGGPSAVAAAVVRPGVNVMNQFRP